MGFSPFPRQRPDIVEKDSIWIFSTLNCGYLGLDGDNALAAIYPVNGKLPPIGRNAGAIRLDYRADVHIETDLTSLVSNCCIVSISDRALERSFWALSVSLAQELSKISPATAHDFSRVFSAWEQLFSRRRRLSSDEEQGLWGELYFLSQRSSVETAVACWRGPNADDYDFLGNGVALEVKTSRRYGRHTVSHAQVMQAVEGASVFLVSVWVGEDPHGLSLPKLVDLVTEQIQDPTTFETKLLETGYSHADARLYDRTFAVLDDIALYAMSTVPRVREVDPGVTSLFYSVQLDSGLALPEPECETVLAKVFASR